MTWWGWAIISILGLITVGAAAGLGYLLHLLLHLMDDF